MPDLSLFDVFHLSILPRCAFAILSSTIRVQISLSELFLPSPEAAALDLIRAVLKQFGESY